ncbi:Hsp20/alpha crystallin family protein [Arthrobacter sp. I2-34]|uniref:Hsp20/alpha crystallin family protein n=2 Tax=Arthrobacter hankyongi TaxID=2904801 RepID=A0ABS9L604_9MICC|nr:Hsp20/alpha crystallin family protein [Arthrobacter hankyongi]MCG2622105.1 Hsp20/alpha crystallin family protein [Arthrobacter hankyongi]
MRRDRFDMPEPFRRFFEGEWDASWLRVEEFRDGPTMVVRAELPGVDPDQDVDITVREGTLHIRAERRERTEEKTKSGYRSEFRYGSFSRNVTLPPGCRQEDVTATYRDGVLEVRIPVPQEPPAGTGKVNISRG